MFGEEVAERGSPMRVQTFMGKVSVEGLRQLDEHVNNWITENNVEPKSIHQVFGYERSREGGSPEPVIITSVWY